MRQKKYLSSHKLSKFSLFENYRSGNGMVELRKALIESSFGSKYPVPLGKPLETKMGGLKKILVLNYRKGLKYF